MRLDRDGAGSVSGHSLASLVPYTPGMHSVLDDLRREDREELAKLPLEERIRRVFDMGEIGLEAFRQAQGVDRETAIRLLERRKQAGRTPSKCMDELIG